MEVEKCSDNMEIKKCNNIAEPTMAHVVDPAKERMGDIQALALILRGYCSEDPSNIIFYFLLLFILDG